MILPLTLVTYSFQFLIGRLKTNLIAIFVSLGLWFQFLIGRLKT